MSTNIDRAADVIQKKLGVMSLSAEDTARALAEEGLIAPELPEPIINADDGLMAEWGTGYGTVIADGPRVWGGGYTEPLNLDEARALGLALLAAADRTEEASHV